MKAALLVVFAIIAVTVASNVDVQQDKASVESERNARQLGFYFGIGNPYYGNYYGGGYGGGYGDGWRGGWGGWGSGYHHGGWGNGGWGGGYGNGGWGGYRGWGWKK